MSSYVLLCIHILFIHILLCIHISFTFGIFRTAQDHAKYGKKIVAFLAVLDPTNYSIYLCY